jgi:sec-independent protein translocase protein TatB
MDSFFGIGMFELVMIAVIALIVLGPERLPGAMREVGKYARQLRDVSNEFQSQFSEELKVLDEINPKRMLNEVMDPKSAPPASQPVAPPAAPPAWPAATHPPKPAAPAAPPPPIPNAEPSNSILPPARQDPPAPPVSDSASNTAEPPASDANPGRSSDGAPGAVQ